MIKKIFFSMVGITLLSSAVYVFAWTGATEDPPGTTDYIVPILLAPDSVHGDSSSNPSVWINKTSAGNLMELQIGGVAKFMIMNNGRIGIGTNSPGGLIGLKDANTYIDVDASNNLTFTDTNAGTLTLTELSAGGGGSGGSATFDAVVDASGGGDYTNVSDAINAGETSIFIKDGAYSIDQVVTISTPGTVLYGESRDGVQISMPNVHNLTINVSASNVVFENMTLYKAWNTSLITWTGSGGLISNCIFENRYATQGSYGWYLLSGSYSGIHVENSVFKSTQGYVIQGSGANNTFTGNTIETTGWGGALLSSGANSHIIENSFSAMNASGNSQYGIDVGVDSVISGNILHGATDMASNYAAISADDGVITDNIITGFYDGIWSDSGEKGAVVNNNIIRDVSRDGIKLSGSCNSGYSGIEVVGNSINNSGQDGIRATPGCNLVISNNNIKGSTRYGIRGDYDFWRTIISNNNIRENSGGGIVMDSGEYFENSIVSNNMILSNGGYAIDAGRIYYSVFLGNIIRYNTNNQIYYPSGTLNSEIQHNVIH